MPCEFSLLRPRRLGAGRLRKLKGNGVKPYVVSAEGPTHWFKTDADPHVEAETNRLLYAAVIRARQLLIVILRVSETFVDVSCGE